MAFDQSTADRICALVAEGYSVRKAGRESGVPAPTFLLWCSERKELAERYARAREMGNDAEFEELQELQDLAPQVGPSGAIDPGWVAWKRLQVDTRKWALSKKAPKKYGDKIETTHEMGDSVSKIVREIVRAG
jgi:hypothetical protein